VGPVRLGERRPTIYTGAEVGRRELRSLVPPYPYRLPPAIFDASGICRSRTM
jgi:hypothetical protein